jgi:hypothetical protein
MRSEERSTSERRLEYWRACPNYSGMYRAWRKRMEGARACEGKLIGNSMAKRVKGFKVFKVFSIEQAWEEARVRWIVVGILSRARDL